MLMVNLPREVSLSARDSSVGRTIAQVLTLKCHTHPKLTEEDGEDKGERPDRQGPIATAPATLATIANAPNGGRFHRLRITLVVTRVLVRTSIAFSLPPKLCAICEKHNATEGSLARTSENTPAGAYRVEVP